MTTDKQNKVLNVPNLRFPEFTEAWSECELYEISHISKGAGISKDQLSESGSPCILYGELYTKYKTEIITEIFSKTDIDDAHLVRSKKNDVIIPSSGETAIDISTARCVPFNDILLGGDLTIIRLQKHDGRFFSYQLNGVRKKDIAKIAQGVSVVHLYGENLKRLKVKYPSVNEQNKISSLLALIDERIATQSRIIDKLQSLMVGIVVSHYDRCGYKTSIKIQDLGEAYSVGNLSKEDLSEDGQLCILYGELFTTYGCVASEIISRTHKYTQATLSRSGDLLFPASTTVDAISLIAPTAIRTDGVYVAGDMFGIHISSQYNSEYISYLLNYVYNKKLSKYAQGSTIIHLHYVDIKNAIIQVPCLEEQNKCANLLECFQAKLDIAKQLILCYQNQKDYLLRQMFI